MENEKRNFDEGFDNILIYDYDTEYENGLKITAESLVDVANRPSISLNGEWNFAPDVFNSVVRSRWFDETKQDRNNLPIPYDFSFEEWEKLKVPGIWNNQNPEYALYEGTGLYFKEFSYTEKCRSRVYLRIGAANYEIRIWLNKDYLGRHKGGFTPFMIDVTEHLKEKNRLLIYVDNSRKGEQIPSLHYDWFNYGGIHREVELFELPESYIKEFQINLDKRNNVYELAYHITAYGKEGTNVVIHIPELDLHHTILLTEKEEETCHAKGYISIKDEVKLELWSPQNPKLYEVEIEYQEDRMKDQIGLRTIEAKGSQILLNDESIFLKGMCVHEESSTNLRSVNKEDIIQLLQQAKELGCNFLRLTHYPHSELVARLADEYGMLLLEEIPVYWALEFENPKTFEDANNQLQELIRRDINRASVIIWSVGNENPDSDSRYHFMKQLTITARELDQSRLIGASCLIDLDAYKIKDRLIDELDVIGINEYYGWYIRDFSILEKILNNSEIGKPLIITETGADAVSGFYSEEKEIYSEELQADIYRKQFEILLNYPFIRGIAPWILYDYRSMRRLSILQKGYNLKGIIDKDRNHKKLAYYEVQKVYRSL